MATIQLKSDEEIFNSIMNKNIVILDDEICNRIGQSAFYNCAELQYIYLSQVRHISNYAFAGCLSLKAVVLFNNAICTLEPEAFSNSNIENGDGYIYVPSALIDDYKEHSQWSYIASRIRAIEDYPFVATRLGKAVEKGAVSPTWSPQHATFFRFNERWLALYADGNFGGVYYSEDDGKTWVSASGTFNRKTCKKIINYQGRLVMYAASSTSYYGSSYSDDGGKSWAAVRGCTSGMRDVQEVGGMLFALVGSSSSPSVYYSNDGIDWTKLNITGIDAIPLYDNGVFVAWSASAGMWYSEDGTQWAVSNIASNGARPAVNDGRWVFADASNAFWYSDDGMWWISCNTIPGHSPQVINGQWFALGTTQRKPLFSNDGIEWQVSESANFYITSIHTAMRYTNGYYFLRSSDYDWLCSTDLRAWAYVRFPTSAPSYINVYGGMFWYSYGTTAYYSTDLQNWMLADWPVSGSSVMSVRVGIDDKMWIGTIGSRWYWSVDLLTWLEMAMPLGNEFQTAAYHDGTLVINTPRTLYRSSVDMW